MKRNQTFSCLSSKGHCDTLNTSKNEIFTEEKKRGNMLELKISIKKDKNIKDEKSVSVLHSPHSKHHLSSNKKKGVNMINIKKHSGKKKGLDTSASSSNGKISSLTKLSNKNSNYIHFVNPKRGYNNSGKRRKGVSSEAKKETRKSMGGQFNDISEIQEFNITDEESLINASILKNIEEHESINNTDAICRQSIKKVKIAVNGKSLPSTSKKGKNGKKARKVKYISSAKKNIKTKRKKIQSGSKEKQNKKRKVVFHMSKQSESIVEQSKNQEEDEDITVHQNQPQMINIETFDQKELNEINKGGKIKKVEFANERPLENIKSDESLEPPTEQNYDDYIIQSVEKVDKNIERIDIINSEKLSELLSSKKKDRYKNVIDSMDEIEEEPIGQQINFDDQQYIQEDEKENIEDNSKISIIDGSVDQAEGEISASQNSIEPKHDISILTSNSD